MEISGTVKVGQSVPDFELEIYHPKERSFGKIRLADLKREGKWTVLFFYPADFTFVCPTELADLAEKHPALQELDVEIISVSTDTKFTHLAWRDAEKLLEQVEYPMGADTTGKLSRAFGVYDDATGLALRGTFIISPEGVLVSAEINYYNLGRNADELVRKMEGNVYLREHPEEACPARWRNGAKTLRPSAELVGQVHKALAG